MKNYKTYIILMLFVGFHLTLDAKKNRSNSYVDKIMYNIPDSYTSSTQDIADYINLWFKTDNEKSRAIFYWVANNISYDINNMYSFSIDPQGKRSMDSILKYRRGICHDYVLLFKNIADKVNLETFVVSGYTKMNGQVNGSPHAWIAARIDSNWVLTDPTWGSGYIDKEEFIKTYNADFSNAKPERFIKTHIPFDPIWQLLNYPITKQQFHKKKIDKAEKARYFSFVDSIQNFKLESRIERFESMRDRILSNGIANYLDHDHMIHLQSKIAHYYIKKNEAFYYSALIKYNDGIQLLNKYIRFKNNYYLPYQSDAAIRQMIKNIEELFGSSMAELNKMEDSTAINYLKQQLRQSINEAMTDLNKQYANLENCLKIAKNYRENLAQNMNE